MSDVTIKITADRGTTRYEFETTALHGITGDPYASAEAAATKFESWLSAQPDRQQENDRRSRERSS